jgi:hypothetical protein
MLFRKRFLIFLILCFEIFPAFAQIDSCHLQISLLTCGPGEDLYSIWGHTAIRVRNDYTHSDTVYNYGTFDDSDPYFYLKFTRGIMLYSLSVEPFSYFMEEYVMEHRSVTEQILRLSCTEKEKLLAALQTNAKEQNRYYNYHFYNDNCTLRARDIIVNNSADAVTFKDIRPSQNSTFRNLINSYLDKSNAYWSKLGINICLGSHLDEKMDNQQAMFLPDYLMAGFENGMKNNRSLVSSTHEILPVKNLNQNNSSWFTPGFLSTILLLSTIVLSFVKTSWSKTVLNIFDLVFFLSIGLVGILILSLWLGRVDTVCRNNMNILWALPTHTIIVFFMKRRYVWVKNYFRIAALICVVLLLGWKWWPQELMNALIPLCLLIIFRSISIVQKKQ